MGDVQYSVLSIAESIGSIVFDPIFYLMAMIVTYLYKRQVNQFVCTKDDEQYLLHAIQNICIGVVVGVGMSYGLTCLGVKIVLETNILLLIPVAMVLMMVNTRFGCFSYVVAVMYMIEGLLESVTSYHVGMDYGVLIRLVGSLHIIEGILVMARGGSKSIPTIVYVEDKLVVKKILHQIWLVPIFVNIPGYSMSMPIYAILAYNDLANREDVLKQSRWTGLLILVFGVLVCLLADLYQKQAIPLGAVIVMMPICHEFIFVFSQWQISKAK